MDQQDEDAARGKPAVVVDIGKYRGRPRKRRPEESKMSAAFGEALDDATRDLHAAASTTMKLVYLARERMGLPPI
jgi:hypothetical protein